MWRIQGWCSGGCFLGLAIISQPVFPQQVDLEQAGADESPTARLEEVVVTATRSAESIAAIPGAVRVITRQQIEQQMNLSRDLGDMLGKLIPGMGVSSQTGSNEAQTLRGRKVLVLIDGVPQNTTRDVSRNLSTIHPSAIERIEVVPGATAIYGQSAAGGVINILTKVPGKGPMELTTDTNFNFSLSHPGSSYGGFVNQGISGQKGAFDYLLNGTFEHVGGFFDAEGDRIPPDPHGQQSLDDSNNYNIFGKFGFNFYQQRLQFEINHFKESQDTDFISDPAVKAFPPGTKKARALKGLVLDDQRGTENTLLSLDYHHADLFGNRVHAQFYHQDFLTRFGPFGPFASIGNQIGQSRLESERFGARLEIETFLPKLAFVTPTLLWGADYFDEETSQPLAIFDQETVQESNGLVFEKIDEQLWVPALKPRNLGLFAQLEADVTERLILRGGVRYQRIWFEVPTFTVLADGRSIQGDTLNFDETLFNAGAVFYLTNALNVFANFSQGFSTADIGLFLRFPPQEFTTLEDQRLEAQKVDNYEVGLRGDWRTLQFSLTGFYNESDLGTRSAGFGLPVVRAPERIYGFDATVDIQPMDRLRLGAAASWVEGESRQDTDGDGVGDGAYQALNGFRIPPVKIFGYIEFDTVPRWQWRNRVQVLYSGDRERAFEDLGPMAFGGRKVESFTTVDLISTLQLGPGTLKLGVENLLNNQYFTPVSQMLRNRNNTSYAAARGAVFNIGYSVAY
ncbi:TonB-dependent receptor [Nitrosococcus oceani]|uniref:TonB-dependent receptor n=2 Tax=Nitrosococcus oceani TaxID=1229 RepID=Q3JB77_NITOC|nr:TonB-dependent receptor [Nitrosococcus oceani]KFI19647.1 ligand-gated channel [Nitrosococcus oceani C-27]ABA57919.1 TonB-dependent receptor [Nitrosococcus oceani ATCC 19707]EDZ67611.1 TonB-dependent receptor domain protein [Nitrosococcus oceani AFC27]KFI22510.1 ligand-gated channel [Nitrosococcus oceani]GEM19562.1 ligand-gated channel [Nitrosococcus oceani]